MELNLAGVSDEPGRVRRNGEEQEVRGPRDKRMTIDEVVAQLEDGMTIGIGGWGRGASRWRWSGDPPLRPAGPHDRQLGRRRRRAARPGRPGSAARLRLRLPSTRSRLEPNFSKARQEGTIPELVELDEGMFQTGLRAAAQRLPFLRRCGPASAPTSCSSTSRGSRRSPARTPGPTARWRSWSPYRRCNLDVALVHLNRADRHGNATYLGPDPYFDDLSAWPPTAPSSRASRWSTPPA